MSTFNNHKLSKAIDLTRRLPAKKLETNVGYLLEQIEEGEELLGAVDLPLKLGMDTVVGEPFLISDFNRDMNSYRSPWSNQYFPEAEEGAVYPEEIHRKLEIDLNSAFKVYTDLYYDGAVSSAYVWSVDPNDDSGNMEESFACAILFSKTSESSGSKWDSIHVIQADSAGGNACVNTYRYSITTTVIMNLSSSHNVFVDLSGNMTRSDTLTATIGGNANHVSHIGGLVEAMENKIRGEISDIYFSKTKDIVNECRSFKSLNIATSQKQMQSAFLSSLAKRMNQ